MDNSNRFRSITHVTLAIRGMWGYLSESGRGTCLEVLYDPDSADQEGDLTTMRRSDALRRNAMWPVLGVALAISLLGSTVATTTHTHARGTDYPQDCAVCHVIHQPVQVGDAVELPEPALPGVASLKASVPTETPARWQYQPRLSRAPPA